MIDILKGKKQSRVNLVNAIFDEKCVLQFESDIN